MQEQLREKARKLLEKGEVDLIIGYGEASVDGETIPVFIRRPEEVDKLVWNNKCFNDLAVFLTRPEVKACKKVGVVMKGCDARAVAGLIQEEQLNREQVCIIGVSCEGVGEPLALKCQACDVRTPTMYDLLIGNEIEAGPKEEYADVEAFEKKSWEERWEFWKKHLSRCIKCYACRQVCPLCYCKQCIVDKNMPQWIDTSPHLKGNISWHVHRAFHLAGRCIGCGECERVCPENIPLSLINRKLAQTVERLYGYRAGYDKDAESVFTSYAQTDSQEFIY